MRIKNRKEISIFIEIWYYDENAQHEPEYTRKKRNEYPSPTFSNESRINPKH